MLLGKGSRWGAFTVGLAGLLAGTDGGSAKGAGIIGIAPEMERSSGGLAEPAEYE